jgi:hypothetical protein
MAATRRLWTTRKIAPRLAWSPLIAVFREIHHAATTMQTV